ncbi:MAG: SPFH domain-containing protein [Myxococcales bacterium]|nr:SPFH domain-containing protein [Myxococcales bacterium]
MGTAAILGILGIALTTLVVILTRLLYVCQPNEVLVFAGRRRRGRDHNLKGYRIIRGGRGVRIPLFETVSRMDLTNMIIDVQVHNAYSKGGIPLSVQGVANIKIPGEEPLLNNALERFLGHGRDQIKKFAQDTLEGNLRGVLATLTPEEVNQDKERFATQLAGEAEHDFNRLGLVLDTLKIQNVSDQVGYLDAIGRRLSAEIRRDAQLAEAEAQAEAAEKKWYNTMNAELAKISAAIEIARKENDRRVADAETQREASIAKERADVHALIVEAQAQVQMQLARIEQVRRQLDADVLQPALATKRKAEEHAKAEAAKVIQSGRATAQVLKDLAAGYAQSGAAGRDALLMQKLLPVTEKLAQIGGLKVDRVTLLGTARGDAGASGPELAGKLVSANEQIKAVTGVDLGAVAKQRLDPDPGDAPPPSVPPPPPTPRSEPPEAASSAFGTVKPPR